MTFEIETIFDKEGLEEVLCGGPVWVHDLPLSLEDEPFYVSPDGRDSYYRYKGSWQDKPKPKSDYEKIFGETPQQTAENGLRHQLEQDNK